MGREKSLKCAARDFKLLSKAAEDPQTPSLVSIQLAPSSTAASSEDTSIFTWRLSILPPAESIYGGPHPRRPSENLTYEMEWNLHPDRYPHDPPEIRVLTPIFHPLVDDSDGKLCEGVLTDGWKPTTSAVEVLEKVVQTVFLQYDTAEMPSNAAAAKLLAERSGGDRSPTLATGTTAKKVPSEAFAAEVAKKKALIP